jgi:predicted nuclease of predicted toxin-antitoxin system
MRLLADENLPRLAVQTLRSRGHDLVWVKEERPGITDPEVLSFATSERRILLTFDKGDFGELIFQGRQKAPFGIILFRIRNERSPSEIAQIIVNVVEQQSNWSGHFSVVHNENRMRMIPLS